MTILSLDLRFFLGCVFAASSVPKLVAPRDFAHALLAYRVVPDRFAGAIAAWLPLVELAIAVSLFAGIAPALAALVAGALLVAMAAAVAVNVASDRIVDCGCFGRSAPRQTSWLLVAQNLGLTLASGVVATRPAGFQLIELGPSASAATTLQTIAGATVALVAVVGAGLVGDMRRVRSALDGFARQEGFP